MPGTLPLVTIVTSTYKHEKYLRKTIDSVLGQDYPNIEYIVINDGSPDGTEDILKSYGDKFHWETQPNMGEVPTLNRAIRMAKGDIIGKLSSDDYLYPGAIREMVELFQQNPDAIVVYSDFDLVDENNVVYQSIQKDDYDLVHVVRNHLCLPGPATLFKKSIFEQLGRFDAQFRILFDMDFWWRAGLLGPFKRVPRPITAFRQHRESQSSSGGERMAAETVRCVEKFYSTPKIPRKFKRIRSEAFCNAYYAAGCQCFHINKKISRSYLLKSFLFSPGNYFKFENRIKLVNLVEMLFLPKKAQMIIKFLKHLEIKR